MAGKPTICAVRPGRCIDSACPDQLTAASIKKTETSMRSLAKLLNDEAGSNAAEYALIIALVAGVIILAATAVGTSISGLLTTVGGAIAAA
jgi:Flp pilus assembly pilin Flp